MGLYSLHEDLDAEYIDSRLSDDYERGNLYKFSGGVYLQNKGEIRKSIRTTPITSNLRETEIGQTLSISSITSMRVRIRIS